MDPCWTKCIGLFIVRENEGPLFSVEDTVIYALEPGSDSELSDLFDSDDLWSKLDLEIDQIDPDTEADNVLSISNEHGDKEEEYIKNCKRN